MSIHFQESFPFLFTFIVAGLGACFGSFAALIIYRLPQGISIVSPSSYCGSCKKGIKPWHNIPIFSWLMLRGKCAYCQRPFGQRTLVLEIVFMLCALVIYRQVGFGISFVEKFGFAFLLICLAYIDLDTYYLPLSLLLALLCWGVIFTVIYSIDPYLYRLPSEPAALLKLMVFGKKAAFSLSDRLGGAALGLAFLSLINAIATLIFRRIGRLKAEQWAMGWGDPLLLMGIGLFVGQSHLLLVIFLASLLGSVVGIVLRIFSNVKNLPEDIAAGALPYGPFLAIAGIYTYLL